MSEAAKAQAEPISVETSSHATDVGSTATGETPVSSSSSPQKKAVTTDYTDEALHDMPKIKSGIQHLLTIALAKIHVQNQNGDKSLSMNKDMAKHIGVVLLNKINAFQLPPIQEWVRTNPRTGERTREQRMEDLSKYGCIHSLQVLAKSRRKSVCEFFGRNFFTWTNIWATIRDSIYEDESANPTMDRNVLKYSLTMFGKSLSATDDDYGDDMRLVWNVHCFEILKARHSKLHEAQELRKGIDEFTRKVEDKTLVGMRPDRARKPGDEEDVDDSEDGNSTPREAQLAMLIPPSPSAASSKSSFSPISFFSSGNSQAGSPTPSASGETRSVGPTSPLARILSSKSILPPLSPKSPKSGP